MHAGDPITLDLHLRAEGLSAAQLPDLSTSLSLPAGLKAYPDQPKLDNAVYQDTVAGTRDQSVALIADRPGKFELPAVHVSWWDVKANQSREATLPARTLTVLPAAGGAVPPATPESTTAAGRASGRRRAGAAGRPLDEHSRTPSNLPWILLSGGFGHPGSSPDSRGGFRRRRKPVPAATPRTAAGEIRAPVLEAAQARREFHAACDRNEPLAARRLLLAWVAGAWPESAPQGLTEFAKRLGDERVDEGAQQARSRMLRPRGWEERRCVPHWMICRRQPTSRAAATRISHLYTAEPPELSATVGIRRQLRVRIDAHYTFFPCIIRSTRQCFNCSSARRCCPTVSTA